MKKMISVMMVISIVISMAVSVVHAENSRDAFSDIKFSSADLYNWSENQISAFENGADNVGESAQGYWTLYGNVDFGTKTAGAFNINVARSLTSTGIVKVYAVNGTPDYGNESFEIDSYSGDFTSDTIEATLIARCKLDKDTGGWGAGSAYTFSAPLLTDVSGKHDIIITLGAFNGSTNQYGDICSFSFTEKSPFNKINFVSADVISGLLSTDVLAKDTDGSLGAVNVLGDTDSYKYAVFNNMDFGDKGISYVNMAIGSTGQYSHYAYVYLAPSGTATADLTVVNGVPQLEGAVKAAAIEVTDQNVSGDWNNAKLHTAAVQNGENFVGKYDVIVTFSGTGVGNFAWLNFNGLGSEYKPFERMNFIQADVKTVSNLNEYLETDVDGKPGTVNGIGGVSSDNYVLFKNVDIGEKGINYVNMAIGAGAGSHSGNANVYLLTAGTTPADLKVSGGKPKWSGAEKIASVYVDESTVSGNWSAAKYYTAKADTNGAYTGCYDVLVTFSTVGIGNFFWMNFDNSDMTDGVTPEISDGMASAATKIVPGSYPAIMINAKNKNANGIIHLSIKSDSLTLVDDDIEITGNTVLYSFKEEMIITQAENCNVEITAIDGNIEELCPSIIYLISSDIVQKAESFVPSRYYNIKNISWVNDHYGSTNGDNSFVEFFIDFGKTGIYDLEYEYATPNYATSILMYVDDVLVNSHNLKYSGGWSTKRRDTAKIKNPLGGTHKVMFKFTHHGFGDLYDIAFNKVGLNCIEEYKNKTVTRITLMDLEDNNAETPMIISASYDAGGKLLSVTEGITTRNDSVVKNEAAVNMGSKGYIVKTMMLDDLGMLTPLYEYIVEDSVYSLDDTIDAYTAFKPAEKFWSTNGLFISEDASYKMGGTRNNTMVRVGNVDFGAETLVNSLTVNYATGMNEVVIKFYLDNVSEENLVAVCNAENRAGWGNFVDEELAVNKTISGLHDVIVSYEGKDTNVSACDFNTLVFNK